MAQSLLTPCYKLGEYDERVIDMAGLGSIQKRGKNSWFLTVSCGRGPDNKLIRKTRTVRGTKREAEQALIDFIKEIKDGIVVDAAKMTFREFVEEKWFKEYVEKKLAPKTIARYKQLWQGRVLSSFGHIKIRDINPMHIISFCNKLEDEVTTQNGRERKLSGRTVLMHFRLLSAILADAVEWQIIPHNPAERVKPPRAETTETPVYEEDTVAALLEALSDEKMAYRIIVILALSTGLRQGEVFGLEWPDIDLDKATLEVRRTAGYAPGIGVYTKEPKTKMSKRLIALPASLVDILRQYKAEQEGIKREMGDKWKNSNRVFVTWDGKGMFPNLMSSWFPKFLRRKGLPPLNFHGLRHLSATYMIIQGAPIKNVSARLGHAKASTTIDLYSHALKSVDREIADKMDNLVRRDS